MHIRHHPLPGASAGTRREILSHHYGTQGAGEKVYVQASLHADELPGMLVAHHLRRRLAALEAEGRLAGEVIVVPAANPIGLAQAVLRTNAGRFDLASGANFNRDYPVLADAVWSRIAGRLGADADANVRTIRAAIREAVAALPAESELAGQRKLLLGLAADADVVLDLHCDGEALVHLYTSTLLWPAAEPLARSLGAEASLLAIESGGHPFDEACSHTWARLRELARTEPTTTAATSLAPPPIPLACLAVTVELRGAADVSHELASADADALIAFLVDRGVVEGPRQGRPPALPPLRREATPLEAVDVLVAPVAGLVVYRRSLGDRVARGDVVLEVVEPMSGEVHEVASRTDGLLFAREVERHAHVGRSLCKIAGTLPVRSGKLTSE